ncbi:MAG: ParA family protein [Anaerolineae bacterium]|nr:MAG: ParA family protein [Anaerolineae bacterium]
MKVVTLLNEKGGVGKTTLAHAIACGLAIRGHRVLAVDGDPQANLTMGFGQSPSPAFYDLIVREAPFNETLLYIDAENYKVPSEDVKGFVYLIPSNKETRTISQNTDNVLAVRQRLTELEDEIDVVVFDTSPTPSLLHASIYLATDYLLFPVELEYYSFAGLGSSIGHRNGFSRQKKSLGLGDIEVMGIIPNKYRPNTLEHQENLEKLQAQFKGLVWQVLPQRIIWSEAAARKRSVFNYAPDSAATEDAWQIVKNVERVLQRV